MRTAMPLFSFWRIFFVEQRRQSALARLGRADIPGTDGDELLLACFFLAVLAFFSAFWRGDIDMASIYKFRHPPPPVRIKYAIQVAEMWCGLNGSVPQSWFSPARFQELFHAAVEVIGETVRRTWDAQMSFLRSEDGVQYDQQLFERFEAVRQKRDEFAQAGLEVRHCVIDHEADRSFIDPIGVDA